MMRVISLLLLLLQTTTTQVSAFASPKVALTKLVVENLNSDSFKLSPALQEEKEEEFVQLLDSLWDESKGYSADTVEGIWTPVLSLPGKKKGKKGSSKKQSLVGNKVEKAGSAIDTFDIAAGEIHVTVPTPRGNGQIAGLLAFEPTPTNYSISADNKIVLRRINVENVKATFKYRFLPKIRIPGFKKTGGYLDFIYLDNDIRVTKGNRGGTFVHMRKEYLDKVMNEYSS